MIIGLSIQTFTTLHVAISLIAIVSGLIVLFGMLRVRTAARLDSLVSGHHHSYQRYRVSCFR